MQKKKENKEDKKMLFKLYRLIMDMTYDQALKDLFNPDWEGWCKKCHGLHRTENCHEKRS